MAEEFVNLDEQAKHIHLQKLQYMAETGQMQQAYGVPWNKTKPQVILAAHPDRPKQPSNFQQRGRQFGQQNNNNRDRSRTRDDQPGRLYQINIHHIMAYNTVADLIADIQSRCKNLEKLIANVDNVKSSEKDLELVLKAFFTSRESADSCLMQYNDAELDNRKLRAERKY